MSRSPLRQVLRGVGLAVLCTMSACTSPSAGPTSLTTPPDQTAAPNNATPANASRSQVWDPARSRFVAGRPSTATAPTKMSWDFDIRESVMSAIAGDAGIFADFPDGTLVSYDPASGEQAWKVNLPKLAGTRPEDTTDLLYLASTPDGTYLFVTRPLPNPDPTNGNLYEQTDVFDASSGKFLWGRSAHPDTNTPPLPVSDSSFALPIIRTDADNYGKVGGLEAFDAATGALKWKNTEVGACTSATDTVLCNGAEPGTLAALDPATGTTKWIAPLPKSVDGEPPLFGVSQFVAVVGDTVFSGAQLNTLAAFDRETGKERWKIATPFEEISHGLPLDDARILIAGVGPSGTLSHWELQLVAVNIADGSTTTFYEYDFITDETGITAELTLSQVNGESVVVLQDAHGKLTSLDLSGKVIATDESRCARTLNKGDVLLCYSTESLTLLSLPNLKKLAVINDSSNAQVHIVGDHWIGAADYRFLGYSP